MRRRNATFTEDKRIHGILRNGAHGQRVWGGRRQVARLDLSQLTHTYLKQNASYRDAAIRGLDRRSLSARMPGTMRPVSPAAQAGARPGCPCVLCRPWSGVSVGMAS